ncbi:MAG: hypothetical protein CVU27_08645 [Betaproteobacteria bacterium HGW-Betaproteobacteria-20]|jgi:putative SOS response-associated peptidase YedK|nr:MAG: hypothetical protein CVU27_08645 [Betaproteobacteria bacterium HGW-Betaproteobacteria-20]
MPRKYILASKLETIQAHFGAKAPQMLEWEPGIIVSPGDESLIITQQNPGELMLSSFGMTPAWSKSRMNLINARTEGDKNPENDPAFRGSKAIFLKPAFKKPLFSHRCIVIADAFIEFSNGILPKPYLIHLRDHKHPIGLAGLYDIWKNPSTQALHHTFTIITVVSNSLVHSLPSSRMPVILLFISTEKYTSNSLQKYTIFNK